ncbi:Uncharacterised protein [Mycobacterium tuberculosis]|nr:Uncharacterised protein [Mycobacterium tuberculosis]
MELFELKFTTVWLVEKTRLYPICKDVGNGNFGVTVCDV